MRGMPVPSGVPLIWADTYLAREGRGGGRGEGRGHGGGRMGVEAVMERM